MQQVPNMLTMQPLNALDGPIGVNNIDEGRFYYVHFEDAAAPADYVVKIVSKDYAAATMKVLPLKYRNPNDLQHWMEADEEPFAVMGHQGVPLQHAAPANIMPNMPEEYLAWDVEFDTVGNPYLFYLPHQYGGKRLLNLKKRAKGKTRKDKGKQKGRGKAKATRRTTKK
jgi:hypothetical protein